jgi:hypothetical protein
MLAGLKREVCVISGVNDLEHLYTFPSFPIFMGCTEEDEATDVRQNMSWWISRSSGLIQLKDLVALESLYPQSHGSGEVGRLWNLHHKAFATFLNRVKPTSVFEIGGARGILELEYQSFDTIPWAIVEPNPNPIPGTRASFLRGFFSEEFEYDRSFDTLVHSHVFEHIYDPVAFIQTVGKFLSEESKLVFSVPNLEIMLERKYTNHINFEHTIFLTETYIEHLLSIGGFEVTEKEYFMEDHSIFYSAIKKMDTPRLSIPDLLYEKHRTLYLDYVAHHLDLVERFNNQIAAASGPVYLFGAHAFTQYLIAFGLDTTKVVAVIDNDTSKHAKRLYGTGLIVVAPNVLSRQENPFVVLKAGIYDEEVRDDIYQNYNPNTSFIS